MDWPLDVFESTLADLKWIELDRAGKIDHAKEQVHINGQAERERRRLLQLGIPPLTPHRQP